MPKDLNEAEASARVIHALEFYESVAPKEGAEGMNNAQMVGTHFAALECLRRAALQDQACQHQTRSIEPRCLKARI